MNPFSFSLPRRIKDYPYLKETLYSTRYVGFCELTDRDTVDVWIKDRDEAEEIITNLADKYWVISGREIDFKKILNNCCSRE